MSLHQWVHLHPSHIHPQVSGVDVGAGAGTGEGVLDVVGDDISSSSMSATNLITLHMGWFSRRVV